MLRGDRRAGHRRQADPRPNPLSSVSSGFRSVPGMACDVMQGLMDARVHAGFETLATARGSIDGWRPAGAGEASALRVPAGGGERLAGSRLIDQSGSAARRPEAAPGADGGVCWPRSARSGTGRRERRVGGSLILLRHKCDEVVLCCAAGEAAWTSFEAPGESGCETSAHRCDGVWNVAFGSDRGRLWVCDGGEGEISGGSRRYPVLRGEWSPVRRSGSHRPRCTRLHGGGNLANLGLRSVRVRLPA